MEVSKCFTFADTAFLLGTAECITCKHNIRNANLKITLLFRRSTELCHNDRMLRSQNGPLQSFYNIEGVPEWLATIATNSIFRIY